MNKREKLLIIVFDGEHARFIQPSKENVLHTERSFDAAEAHKRSADLRSDRPGASFHSDSSAHHALNPRHDPHDLEKTSFIHFVAAEVNAMAEEAFSKLVIAAPVYALNIIKDELKPAVLSKLSGTIPKDLVKTPDGELWEHLKAFVPPASPARGFK